MKRVDAQRELNEALTTLAGFAEAYNKSLPFGFPQASSKALQQFQAAYPLLFRSANSWSIDKHRKRFMDWHATHRDAA